MARTVQTQGIHNQLVSNQVVTFRNEGYTNIKADHINHPSGQPAMVNGHIPDLSAVKNGFMVISEVETNDSINDQSTIQQWKAFDRSSHEFHVVVPKSALEDAQSMARRNGITVDKYWYCDGC
jgi:hypothetical protein